MKNNEKFIIGLGNPGKEYIKNRHNIGFLLLENFSEKYSSSKNPMLCRFLIYSLPGLPKPIINFSLLFIITILSVNFYKL